MGGERCSWCGTAVESGDGFRAYEHAHDRLSDCAWCEAPLGATHVTLVRSRGEHRIPDGFCNADHLLQWARAGGRWRS